MLQAGRLRQFQQRVQRVRVILMHALGLVRHHQRLLARRVLCRHAGRAAVGVALLRLDAAQRKHEAACSVAPVGTHCQRASHVERRDDLARRANLDLVAQVGADQRVVHQQQSFLQRRANVVGKFQRRRARAAFRAVNDDEVREDAGLEHCLDDAEELPRMPDAQFEAGRLAARQRTQPIHKLQEPQRRAEFRMRGRRDAVLADLNTARGGNLGRHLGGRQDATVPRLGALRQLYLDHLHLGAARLFGKAVWIKAAIGVTAAEVAGGDFPDQVAAFFAVVRRDRTLARVMDEVAELRTTVERANSIARQRPEAHRRDVEHRHRIRLSAALAHHHAEVRRGNARWRQRMADPLVPRHLHIDFGAERTAIDFALGALINDAALCA